MNYRIWQLTTPKDIADQIRIKKQAKCFLMSVSLLTQAKCPWPIIQQLLQTTRVDGAFLSMEWSSMLKRFKI